MTERPSPESLLERAAAEEARDKRGRLRIFLGAAPGVGKTFSMLAAARQRREDGVDVVIGWVEAHGRAETDALAEGLERLPLRAVEHRGLHLTELDLDAALARRPGLLLIDELAHTNAPGSRHHKRWQDITELLDAGLDVWTTLNVQHLESVNDLVRQITGVRVRETVPDALFDGAAELEVVDLAPDDLLQRLRDGKVYAGAAADRAAAGFFTKGNLIALRELTLRRSTERVDAQVADWRRDHGIAEPWGTGERLMVAVGPAPQGANLVRATYRMAVRLRAPWIAATVEPSGAPPLAGVDAERLAATLSLAERLGAETVVLSGESVPEALVAFAQSRGVTRLVVGKPTHPRWRDRLSGSLLEALVRRADGIDLLVTTGDTEEGGAPVVRVASRRPVAPRELVEACVAVACVGVLGLLVRERVAVADLAMGMLVPVMVSASRHSRAVAMGVAMACGLLFNLLFIEPYYTFEIADHRYVFTCLMMLVVSGVLVRLTGRVRAAADAARSREQRTAALYAMTRELAKRSTPQAIAEVAARQVQALMGGEVVVYEVGGGGRLEPLIGGETAVGRADRERATAQWVFDQGKPAGRATETLQGGMALHLPLQGARGPVGVLAVTLPPEMRRLPADQQRLLETLVSQAALALERAHLGILAEQARLAAETERLKNDLLSAVSHDLRTPLASITGSATVLRTATGLSVETRDGLLQTIESEGQRLGRLVGDLLDLTRIESGAVRARREWYPVEELMAAARGRLQAALTGRRVTLEVPDALLLAPVDPTLMEQVLINLIENVIRHTAPGAPLTLAAGPLSTGLWMEVRDRGPGLAPGEERRVFEKFYRAGDGERAGGTGLGLAICRAIVAAHQGEIRAFNRPGGGAVFRVELPRGDLAAPSAEVGAVP